MLDARELIAAGLHGLEHITSLGVSLLPRARGRGLSAGGARRQRRAARRPIRDVRQADLDGPEAQALYAVLRERKPWLDPTLAVFERRAAIGRDRREPEMAPVQVAGFAKMKQLTRRAAQEGARVVMGGHSTVPFAARGEAPWRELELLVESGFTPLEAITAATGTAAAFLYRGDELGTLRPGLSGRPGRPARRPAAATSPPSARVERVMAAAVDRHRSRYRKHGDFDEP